MDGERGRGEWFAGSIYGLRDEKALESVMRLAEYAPEVIVATSSSSSSNSSSS